MAKKLGRPAKHDYSKIKDLYFKRVADNACSQIKETRKQIAGHIGCNLVALERALYKKQ